MAELAYAEIVTVEDVVCFSIKEIEESEWSPKTDAGTRSSSHTQSTDSLC